MNKYIEYVKIVVDETRCNGLSKVFGSLPKWATTPEAPKAPVLVHDNWFD